MTGTGNYKFYSIHRLDPGRIRANSSQNGGQAGFQVLGRQALETRAGKALQTAHHERHNH
jgi:hypothetical protein